MAQEALPFEISKGKEIDVIITINKHEEIIYNFLRQKIIIYKGDLETVERFLDYNKKGEFIEGEGKLDVFKGVEVVRDEF